MRSVSVMNRLGMGLGVVIALLGACLLGATPALAGIGGSAVPTWPTTATVGDLLATNITIINSSTPDNNTESVRMTVLLLTPACVQGTTIPCTQPADQDTFKVLTAVGDASTPACAGIGFDIGPPPGGSLSGEFSLVPQADIILGPATGPAAERTCQVNLQLRVFKMPNPADSPGETHPVARVTLQGVTSLLFGQAGGIAEIIISKATPGLLTTSNPNTDNVVAGSQVTDTATLQKAPGAIPPTGSVRFILCQPGEVTTGVGCASPAGTKVGGDIPLLGNSATSDGTTNTTTSGKYCWRGRYLGDDNYLPVNHTNFTDECFSVPLFRISVVVCTAESTPRFHPSDVSLDGGVAIPSTSTGVASTLCASEANFTDLPPGPESISITINP
jgi:hypothetical protein